MPTISAGDKVLVTGANGFIATWIARRLLEKGYAVRGSVRSADKGKFLQELFKSYGDKFEIVVVKDLTREDSFDEAVKGVEGIVHTATPVYLTAASVDEMIGPAVNGTISILKSAAKHGQGVKAVVITSSSGAVLEYGNGKVFTEEDWNELAVRQVNEQGDNALGAIKYCASKTLAEKAAWEFYEKNKSNVKWYLSVLNPPYVYGPVIHDVKRVDDLNASARLWYDMILGSGQSKEMVITTQAGWIDVRDTAEAHVLALEKEAAGGERIIVSAGSYVWQDWFDVANSLSPSPIAMSHKGVGRTLKPSERYDASKAERILGLKYHSMEETTRDTLADFKRRGW